MKSKLLFIITICVIPFFGKAQSYSQYFDGADTNQNNSIQVIIDTLTPNIWQIGAPQKQIFDSAATNPFAIVTDTTNPYPTNDTSEFYLKVPISSWGPGILAIQWLQQLDLQGSHDWGMVEFQIKSDSTWYNAFTNPYIYNFYGFDLANVDTLSNGKSAFTGTDSNWKDIWLCYDISYLSTQTDTLNIRYTIISDSSETNQEGWIMDNFVVHQTYIHTIQEKEQKEYLNIFPNPTTGLVNIQAKKTNQFHIIDEMILRNANGEIVKTYGVSPTKFTIDISDQPNGVYFLTVKTNLQTETVKIVLQR